MSITKVETQTGYKAELTIQQGSDGTVLVKAAAFVRGLRTPAILLREFKGKLAVKEAELYVARVKEGIES